VPKRLSNRANALTDSLPLVISSRAKQKIAAGEDIVNLTVGEPDFPAPMNIKDEAMTAVRDDFTRYTHASGIMELRRAAADDFNRRLGLKFVPEQVIITNGAKQALASTILCTVEPGDEVIYPVPCYASYVDMIRLAGGTPVPLETTEEDRWRIRPEALRALITEKTAAVIINNPNNPTAAAYTAEEIESLGDVLAGKDLWTISDEIYDQLRYDGHPHKSFASVQAIKDSTALVNGVSKTYAMTGYRIGWVAAPLDLAKAIGRMQSQTTGSPNSPAQRAALRALTDPGNEPGEMLAAFTRRAGLMAEKLSEIEGISFTRPEGAFYAFVNVKNFLSESLPDTMSLCNHLLENAGLAIIPGTAFGLEGYVRFSFAASDDQIAAGVDRFNAALKTL
jgi:aspartate aminotransferase